MQGNNIKKFIIDIVNNVDYLLNNVKEFDCENFSINETTELINNLRNRNYFKLVSFIKQKSKDDFFYLYHPILNIETIALCSYYDSNWSNFVLLADKELKHPWIIIQQHSFINYFIAGQRIYSVCKSWLNKDTINKLINLNVSKIKYNKFVFGLGNHRPYHYFVHQYFHFLILKKYSFFADKVNFLKSFYIPKGYCLTNNVDSVTVFLYLIPADYIRKNYGKMIIDKLSEIQRDALKDIEINNNDICPIKYDLSLWIGIPEERRIWKNDIETIVLVLENLSLYFNSIRIFIDGMTSFEGEIYQTVSSRPNFDRIYLSVKKELQHYCVEDMDRLEKLKYTNIEYYNRVLSQSKTIFFKSLSGLTYREKIYYCNKIDIAITESSTTFLTPIVLCQKPGFIFYGDNQYKRQAEIYAIKYHQKVIKEEYIYCKKISEYYLNKEYIYNNIADLLESLSSNNIMSLKYLKMHRLNVLTTQLMIESFKLNDKFGIEFSMQNIILYNEIQKLISCSNDNIEYIKKIPDNQIEISKKKINQFVTVKTRIQNQLSYKLGQTLIINSKSVLGFLSLPFIVLSIVILHKQEQKIYQEKIKKDPSLKLPPLESYPDYKEALKEKECFTYKLGEALIKANKTWYKGGYVKFIFEIRKLKREFKDKHAN